MSDAASANPEGSLPKPQPPHFERAPLKDDYRNVAHAYGVFYKSLLTQLLDPAQVDPVKKRASIESLTTSVPPELHTRLAGNMGGFFDALDRNHQLIASHAGNEVQYLLEMVHLGSPKRAEKVEFGDTSDITFIEPTQGIPILLTGRSTFKRLQSLGLIPSGTDHAVAFCSNTPVVPSLVVLQDVKTADFYQQMFKTLKDTDKHEIHHLIWHFMKEAHMIDLTTETPPLMAQSYDNFRNEAGAYTSSDSSFGAVSLENLVYTYDKDVLQRADQVEKYLSLCMQIGETYGVENHDFLYPLIHSRNFDELMENFRRLTTLGPDSDRTTLFTLLDNYSWIPNRFSTLGEIFRQSDVTFSEGDVYRYTHQITHGEGEYDLQMVFNGVGRNRQLFKALGYELPDDSKILEFVRDRLPFSHEIVNQLLQVPAEYRRNIMLDRDEDRFVRFFISAHALENQTMRELYKRILSGSPEMHKAYMKHKTEIIEQVKSDLRVAERQRHISWDKMFELEEEYITFLESL